MLPCSYCSSSLKTDITSSKIAPNPPAHGCFQEPLVRTVITALTNIHFKIAELAYVFPPLDYKHCEGRKCVLFLVQHTTSGISNFARHPCVEPIKGHSEKCVPLAGDIYLTVLLSCGFRNALDPSPSFKIFSFTWDAKEGWFSSFYWNLLHTQFTFPLSPYNYFTTFKTMEAAL